MSIFFRHLTLMFVLLRGLSADGGVSLNCNQRVEVTYGEDLTLSCDIEMKDNECEINYINWTDTAGSNWNKNTSYFDNISASLQMFNVTEEKNINVSINAGCGMDLVSIRLMVKPVEVEDEVEPTIRTTEPYTVDPDHQTNASKTLASVREKVIPISLAAVSAVIIAVVGVSLYRSKRKQHQRVPLMLCRSDSFLTAV